MDPKHENYRGDSQIEVPEATVTVALVNDRHGEFSMVLHPAMDDAGSYPGLLLALGEARSEAAMGRQNDALRLQIDAHEECIYASVVAALDAGTEAGFGSFSVKVVEEFE
ncbi:MAG: hypothetical protein ACK5E3_06775 [Planctomycetota bacterium]|jgi:hypothetical protein